MAEELSNLVVRITADGSQAIGVLGSVSANIATLASSNVALSNKMSAVGTMAGTVGRTMTKTFGVATIAGLTASAKAAGQLNKELANIGTLSVPTERLKEFKGEIQDIAIKTGKSTSDISDGTYQVVSAFGDAADTMEKVEINAKAAKAGLATTTDSINLTSAVTKAYGDTSAQAVQHVADLAFKTVELGQTTFPELASSMGQVTSQSKVLGVSQEELFSVFATLTGVTGSAAEVSTQLKAVYTALEKPSDNMQKTIEKLGYSSGYTMINTLGLAGTIEALTKATNGSDEELLSLFNNQRALPAILALTGAQADTFTQKLEKMKNASGAATKAFEVQTEGIAKTGFTLEQAKVKMQVAAQNFGESAAPIIGDFADIVDKASTKLSSMSDAERKAIINTGMLATKVGVGLAVGGKALTLGTKLVTTTAKIAPALTGIASVAGPAALGVAGIGAAALTTKAIYDKWYKDNYKFSDGLSEQTQIMTKTRNEWKTLNDLRWEYNDLTDKINNKSLKGEELEGAKSRLDEIAKILKEEYKIDVDSGDIDEAIKKAQELAKYNAKRSETQLQREFNDLTPKYEKAVNELPKLQQKYNEAQAAAKKYRDTKSDIADIDQDYAYSDHSEQSQAEYIEKLTKAMKDAGVTDFGRHLVNLKDKSLAAAMATSMLNGKISALGEDEYKSKIDDYTAAIEQYKQTAESLANVNLDNFAEAIKAGADGEKYLTRISEYAKRGLIDADEYAKKAALIKSGQESLNAVFEQGDASINSFVTDYVGKMKLFGASNEQTQAGLQKMSGLYTDFLHKSEQLPKDQVIRITAEGDIEKIQIVDDKLKELIKKNKVDIKFNVDTGGFDINDLNGNKLGEITVDGTVNWFTGTVEKPGPEKTTVDYEKGNQEQPTKGNAPLYYDYGGQDDPEDRTAKVWYVAANSVGGGILADRFINNATGTDYFPGGFAMVNDQKGISDPRELIVDKGRAFIPEGRDVILPLSKGAKVYTAKQTKAIMERMGIPHYASGKDNSEAFTNARDEWTHYTRTHAVTTTQELEKWVELSKQFKDNQKDIWDIEEQIFSLTQKQMQERFRQSEKWLAHEKKYNGMDTNDYLAGIDRMRAYTEEYYQKGIISHREYIEKKIELDEMYIDEFREGLDKQLEASMKFADEHTYFNDWNEITGLVESDNPFKAFEAVRSREIQAVNEGNQLWEDAQKHISDFGSALFQGRFSQSKRWLDEQVKYFDMSDEEYISHLKDVQKYTQQYLDAGIIGRKEYHEAMTEINHMLWDKQEEMVTDALQKQREAIDQMRQEFSDQEQAIRDSWTVADRKDSIADLSEKVRLYTGAVTERGKEQLKQYQEQLKQIQREEELYQLQQKNNAVIEDMEKQYKLTEDNKKVLLRGIRADIVSAQGAVNSIVSSVENRNNGTEKLLKEIKNAINNVNVRGNTTNYIDSRTQTTTNYNSTPLPTIGSIAFGNWNVLR